MSEKLETVEAVLCEMRDRSNKMVKTCLGTDFGFENFANRIESAWRREKAQVVKAATEVSMAPIEFRYEPRFRRNCERFASLKEATDAWHNECCHHESADKNGLTEWIRIECNPSFGDWLFAKVSDRSEKEAAK